MENLKLIHQHGQCIGRARMARILGDPRAAAVWLDLAGDYRRHLAFRLMHQLRARPAGSAAMAGGHHERPAA